MTRFPAPFPLAVVDEENKPTDSTAPAIVTSTPILTRFVDEQPRRVLDTEIAILLAIPEVRADLEAAGYRADKMPERARLFCYSDERVDSYQTWFRQKGANLKDYKRNPVVPFAHDYSALPIGKALSVYQDEGKNGPRTMALVEIVPRELHPLADMVLGQIDFGSLRGASIGFGDADWRADPQREGIMYAHTWTLREGSIVPVPSNPNALEGGRAAGIDYTPLREWAEFVLDLRTAPPVIIADAENAWRKLFARPTVTIEQIREVVEQAVARPQPQAPTEPARAETEKPAAPAATDVRAIVAKVMTELGEQKQ